MLRLDLGAAQLGPLAVVEARLYTSLLRFGNDSL